MKQFVSNFEGTSYKRDFSIKLNSSLDYEIGEIQSNSGLYAVMFLKTKEVNNESKIEFLIYL